MSNSPTSLATHVASLSAGLSQHARLITLSTAQNPDLPESLVVERFSGEENLSSGFRFDIDALSLSTDIDLKQFIGEEITLRLLQADGSQRAWHGYCTAASWLGADGGVARYRLQLESFLAFLDRRHDSFLFQNMNVTDIVTSVLSEYPQANFRFDITQTLPKRAICTQYRETDLALLTRLLAAEGLSFRFEHTQEDSNESADAHARHQLVIFDSKARAPATTGYDTIRFHRIAATEALDAITDFGAARTVQANAVALAGWHAQNLLAFGASETSGLQAGNLPALEQFDGSRAGRFKDQDEAAQHARLALQALEMDNKTFQGAGAVRQLAAGHAFTLSQHEHYPDGANAFVVLGVTHAAVNNIDAALTAPAAGPLGQLEPGIYRNRFTCVRDTVPIVPRATALRPAPTACGAQVALVVGLPDAALTSSRDHCIKVQFPWQRGQQPIAGGLRSTGNTVDVDGNAPGSEASGTWVRVAEALAGPNWGTQFTPRIGSEVLVDFVEGDIDQPVVVAPLYNGTDLPPFAAGVDADSNHAGTVSGWHSQALDGQGHNQWVVDDTASQLRMRLASSTAATQLNLGYLIAQTPSSAWRGGWRGTGFELRSDAWGVVRGAEGVLLSTTARNQNGASVASTQLDAAEAVAQLKGAADLARRLGDAAAQQTALHSTSAQAAHDTMISMVDGQDRARHPDSVNGQSAYKAQPGSRTTDSAAPAERFAEPAVLMESPAGMGWSSPASTALFAGGQLQWTSQGDLHLSAADTLATASGEATSLFTQGGGVQAIAANGPVSLAAHTDALEILADKAVTVVSVNDGIEIQANQKIVLQAGQSSITLDGGNITFTCPGTFSVKGATHGFSGGASQAADLQKLPDTRVKLFDEAFVLKDQDTGELLANHSYRIKRADGTYEYGQTDDKGHTHTVNAINSEKITIEVL